MSPIPGRNIQISSLAVFPFLGDIPDKASNISPVWWWIWLRRSGTMTNLNSGDPGDKQMEQTWGNTVFFQNKKWNIIPCWCNWAFVETFLGFDFVVFFFEKTCELVLSVSMSSSNFYKCCPTLIFLQIFVVLLLPSSFWSLIPGVSTEVLFATLQHTFFEVKFPCYGKKYCLNSGKPRALDNFLPCFLDSCWMTAALGHLR